MLGRSDVREARPREVEEEAAAGVEPPPSAPMLAAAAAPAETRLGRADGTDMRPLGVEPLGPAAAAAAASAATAADTMLWRSDGADVRGLASKAAKDAEMRLGRSEEVDWRCRGGGGGGDCAKSEKELLS